MSQILILCFHCFGIDSIHLHARSYNESEHKNNKCTEPRSCLCPRKGGPFSISRASFELFCDVWRIHIEQSLLVIHGQFIKGSALREILEACSLATIGVGTLVDVNEIKRARYCVQVTLCSLYRKLVDAVKADGSTLTCGGG